MILWKLAFIWTITLDKILNHLSFYIKKYQQFSYFQKSRFFSKPSFWIWTWTRPVKRTNCPNLPYFAWVHLRIVQPYLGHRIKNRFQRKFHRVRTVWILNHRNASEWVLLSSHAKGPNRSTWPELNSMFSQLLIFVLIKINDVKHHKPFIQFGSVLGRRFCCITTMLRYKDKTVDLLLQKLTD